MLLKTSFSLSMLLQIALKLYLHIETYFPWLFHYHCFYPFYFLLHWLTLILNFPMLLEIYVAFFHQKTTVLIGLFFHDNLQKLHKHPDSLSSLIPLLSSLESLQFLFYQNLFFLFYLKLYYILYLHLFHYI